MEPPNIPENARLPVSTRRAADYFAHYHVLRRKCEQIKPLVQAAEKEREEIKKKIKAAMREHKELTAILTSLEDFVEDPAMDEAEKQCYRIQFDDGLARLRRIESIWNQQTLHYTQQVQVCKNLNIEMTKRRWQANVEEADAYLRMADWAAVDQVRVEMLAEVSAQSRENLRRQYASTKEERDREEYLAWKRRKFRPQEYAGEPTEFPDEDVLEYCVTDDEDPPLFSCLSKLFH